MSRRLIIKTALICIGTFIIANAIGLFILFKYYPVDYEGYCNVVVAKAQIEPGTIISDNQVGIEKIRQTSFRDYMPQKLSEVVGKKSIIALTSGEYLGKHNLLEKNDWFSPDERIIVLPVTLEERLANLIKKGSYVDIRCKNTLDSHMDLILKKIEVKDVLDDAGVPFGSSTSVNSKVAYLKLILNEEDRNKIYTAGQAGKLIYELYCNSVQ